MNDFEKFYSGKPLEICIAPNNDPSWFEPSEAMADIAAHGLEHRKDIEDHDFKDRVLEIYELIAKYSVEGKNPVNYMMCAKELGLPGDIVYMECAPYIMIDPIIEDDVPGVKFLDSAVMVPYGEAPLLSYYAHPETINVSYLDLDLNLCNIQFSGTTVLRFVMCTEYMNGFPIFKMALNSYKETMKSQADEQAKPKKSFLSYFSWGSKAA